MVRCVFISRKISCTCFSIDSFVEGFLKKNLFLKCPHSSMKLEECFLRKNAWVAENLLSLCLLQVWNKEKQVFFRTILNSPWPQGHKLLMLPLGYGTRRRRSWSISRAWEIAGEKISQRFIVSIFGVIPCGGIIYR